MQAPEHLSKDSRATWAALMDEYCLSDIAGQQILLAALEARDRATAARKAIDRDGMTITGRDGQAKAHPLLTVERDNRAAFLAGLKHLNLDIEPVKEIGRPPGR